VTRMSKAFGGNWRLLQVRQRQCVGHNCPTRCPDTRPSTERGQVRVRSRNCLKRRIPFVSIAQASALRASEESAALLALCLRPPDQAAPHYSAEKHMVAVHTGLLLISVRECQLRSCITLEHLLPRSSPIQLPTPAYLNQPLHSNLSHGSVQISTVSRPS
jgi:hypothetical protein